MCPELLEALTSQGKNGCETNGFLKYQEYEYHIFPRGCMIYIVSINFILFEYI